MRASVVIVVLISVVGFLLSGCQSQRSIHSKLNPPIAKGDANWKLPPDGDYLREDYLRSIREKRSTLNYPSHQLEHIRVTTKDNQKLLMFGWNFHEGDVDRAVGRDGRLRRTDNEPIPETYRISAAAGDAFEILEPEKYAGKFRRVSSIEEVTRSATIAGEYVDGSGRHYFFGKDGVAKFPEKSFHYKVGDDHIFSPFDYLFGSGFMWKFEWKGDELLLSEISGDFPDDYSIGEPFLRLKPCVK